MKKILSTIAVIFMILMIESVNPAPVPEPATMLLLGTGLVGFAGMRRRKLQGQE